MDLFLLFIVAETIIYYIIITLKLYFEVMYNRTKDNDELIIKILLFKSLELYRIEVPAIQFKAHADTLLPWLEAQIASGNTPQPPLETHIKREQRFLKKSITLFAIHPKRLHRLFNTLFDWLSIYKNFMKQTISALRCEYLTWHSACGTGDAAATALLTGFLWSVKGNVLKRLKNHSNLAVQPVISIKPDWSSKEFSTAFQCIFSIRIGHVITAVVKSFFKRDCPHNSKC